MSHQRALSVLAAVLLLASIAPAQIFEERQIGGKTVSCVHSGLTSSLKHCGVPEWYEYGFVGVISAIRPIQLDEKEIQVTPEEVFGGKPTSPLTVQTSQAACLPEMAVGDKWLFFLHEEKGGPIVLDYYGNDSRPVSQAKKEIETLRRLQTIGDFAIVRGRVVRGSFMSGKAVPFARVVAHRAADNTLFATTASSGGYYEFPPLPPGKYTFYSDALGLPKNSDQGWLRLDRGACFDLTLDKEPKAELGGHVRRSDGSPMPDIAVLIMSADQTWFTTTKTDTEGYFHDDLGPGKYFVGINLPGAPAWKTFGGGGAGLDIPRASLYYPGVQNRSAAVAIELRQDETRNNVDFSISPQ